MAQKKSAKRKPAKKNASKKSTKKNTSKKAAKKKPQLELNPNQSKLLKNLGGQKKFTASAAHRMTQQSLIDKGLAVTDKTGTKIKSTALGRKYAKKI